MLSDDLMMKICLVFALAGIGLLFLLTEFIEPEKIGIADITGNAIGRIVETSGAIDAIFVKDGHVFMTLSDGERKIKIVVFENIARKQPDIYNIKKGGYVKVRGKIASYKGDLEIIAEKVTY